MAAYGRQLHPLTLIVTVRPASVLTRKFSLVVVAGPAGDRPREVSHVVQDGLATKLLVTAVAVDLECRDALDRGVHRDEVAVLASRELLLKALVLDELGEVGTAGVRLMSSSAVRPSCAAAGRKIKGVASVVRPVRPSTRRDSMTILPNARGVGRLLMYSIFIASAGGRTLYRRISIQNARLVGPAHQASLSVRSRHRRRR